MDATIDAMGRIEIPRDLMERLGLKPGSRVQLETEGHRMTMEPVGETWLTWEEDGLPLLHAATVPEGFDFSGMVDSERKLREEEILGWRIP